MEGNPAPETPPRSTRRTRNAAGTAAKPKAPRKVQAPKTPRKKGEKGAGRKQKAKGDTALPLSSPAPPPSSNPQVISVKCTVMHLP